MNPAAKQILLELKELSGQTSGSVYAMIGLARKLFEDKTWWAGLHGDEDLAIRAIADEYFSMLNGYVTLNELMKAHEAIPLESWQEYRFNLRVIVDLYNDSRPKQSTGTSSPARRIKVAEFDQLQKEYEWAKGEVDRLRDTESGYRKQIEELKVKVIRLETLLERHSAGV